MERSRIELYRKWRRAGLTHKQAISSMRFSEPGFKLVPRTKARKLQRAFGYR